MHCSGTCGQAAEQWPKEHRFDVWFELKEHTENERNFAIAINAGD
jgi:hypothetical protein